MAIIFDGYQLAASKERRLQQKVLALKAGSVYPKIAAIFFSEDRASQFYTDLKQAAAARIGIAYQAYRFSFSSPTEEVQEKIKALSNDSSVTGIIIQKPWTEKWLEEKRAVNPDKVWTAEDFHQWWKSLVKLIAVKSSHGINKDVDGLHPETLAAIKAGIWRQERMVLPATARAVLAILKFYQENYEADYCYCRQQVLIVGKSDLLGRPLYWQINNEMTGNYLSATCQIAEKNHPSERRSDLPENSPINPRAPYVKLVGKSGFNQLIEQENSLKDFSLIITATGQRNLIEANMLSEEVILIDVGEPQNDLAVDCQSKAKFITPVPGGVGPMTVVSLLANAVDLLKI